MTVFDNAMTAARAAVMQSFGEQVTYTAAGGAGSSITAALSGFDSDLDQMEEGTAAVSRGRVLVSAAEVSQPGRGDSVTIGSTTYTVTSWRQVAGGWVCELSRVEPVERSSMEHRRPAT